MKLKDKVALVTGAGRNIGEEIARLFAAEGAKVAVADLDGARAQRVAGEIGDALAVVADVANADEVRAMVDAVVERFGRIDILINNVALSDNKNILDISEEEWNRVIAVTLTAPFLVAKHVAQKMVEQGDGGKIVNIASASGHRGRRRAIAYTAAKGGVVNLTRSMAVQLAPYDIRVNSVSPHRTGSPLGKDKFNPDRPVTNLKGRPGDPIDTARAVLFLVSDDSDFVIGENIFVDGGAMAMDVP
jgi:NAD(P)-dependent dehydrogenase (short-subunit alcohol dehydrogenase family)